MSAVTIALAAALTVASPAPGSAPTPAPTPPSATAPDSAPVVVVVVPAAPVPAPAEPAPAPTEPNPAQPAPAVEPPHISPQQPDSAAAGGDDIVVTAREKLPGDPLAGLNAKSFETIQAVDEAVVGPVAMGYKSGTPKPLRLGLRNFLRNLEEPVIAFNFLLQLKPGRAVKTVGRFAINSTVGIAGLIDVAKRKPFYLPYRPNGFANTFACYGIGPGPYFFLPLVGPTTLRDLIGVGLDRAALPAVIGSPLNQPYYAIPSNVIDALNDRIEIDDQLGQMRETSADPYAATRDLYLKQRKSEIAAICPKHGEVSQEVLPPRPGKGQE